MHIDRRYDSPLPKMSRLPSFLVLCCFIGCIQGANIELDDEENNVNVIQTLLQRLDKHEQRIRVLEVTDRNMRREINQLHFVVRKKDSYLLRLKNLLTKRNYKTNSSEKFAYGEEFYKSGTGYVIDTVEEHGNSLQEKRLSKNEEPPISIEDSKRVITSPDGK